MKIESAETKIVAFLGGKEYDRYSLGNLNSFSLSKSIHLMELKDLHLQMGENAIEKCSFDGLGNMKNLVNLTLSFENNYIHDFGNLFEELI